MQLKHHMPLDYFGIHQGSYRKAIGWSRALVSRKRTASKIYKQPGKRRSGKHRFMQWWLSYRKSWSHPPLQSVVWIAFHKRIFFFILAKARWRPRYGWSDRARTTRKIHSNPTLGFICVRTAFRAWKMLNFSWAGFSKGPLFCRAQKKSAFTIKMLRSLFWTVPCLRKQLAVISAFLPRTR